MPVDTTSDDANYASRDNIVPPWTDAGRAIDELDAARIAALEGGGAAGSPASARALYPESFGARGDVVALADGAVTNGSAVLTSASAEFTAGDVNKVVSIGNAATGPAALHTTIASVESATSVTLAAPAGVTLTDAMFSYGTDDTAALQEFLDELSATHGTGVLSKMYASTAELQITDACHLVATGCYARFGDFASALPTGQGPGVPWTPPYVVGAGIHVMASGLRSALAIPVQAAEVHLRDFAIRFAAPFWSTGHGVYAPGHPTNKGTGIPNAVWSGLKVFGVDGNSYAYWLRNFFQTKFDSLRYWGGGGYHLEHDNGLWAFGNSQFNDCTGKTFVGGTAHAWNLAKGSGGPLNQISTVTLGANAVDPSKYFLGALFNGRTIPATTGSQKLINAPTANVNGLSLVGQTWDNAGESIAAPTLPTEKGPAGGGGLFVDPGGLQIPVDQFGRIVVGPGYGGAIRNPINFSFEVSTNQTISSSGDTYYRVNASSGARSITLPSRASFRGMKVGVAKTDASGNAVSVVPAGADTIEGVAAAHVLAAQGDKAVLIAGQSTWEIWTA
jgi:hypothetical protein